MLDDFASTPARVSLISPCSNQSWITRSWRDSAPGIVSLVRGVTLPVSIRELRVITFCTEPGSYMSLSALDLNSSSGESSGLLASYVG